MGHCIRPNHACALRPSSRKTCQCIVFSDCTAAPHFFSDLYRIDDCRYCLVVGSCYSNGGQNAQPDKRRLCGIIQRNASTQDDDSKKVWFSAQRQDDFKLAFSGAYFTLCCMNVEIHMFLAIGKAASTANYPIGERHGMHIYLRQPVESEPDWAAAEAVAIQNGWAQMELQKAGILPAESKDITEEPFRSCYEEALNEGNAILVYSNPVRSDTAT